jgi:KUP system potassium uptake protein
MTWKAGSGLVAEQRRKMDIPVPDFLSGPQPDAPRVPGTAVYLTSDPAMVPSALFHNLKHYKVMHDRTVFLHVVTEDVPRIDPQNRTRFKQLGPNIFSIAVHYGFREEPDLPDALRGVAIPGLELDPMSTTYFVARSTIVDGPGSLPAWRCALFGWMTRQAEGAATYFNLPPNRVVELGTQVML